MFLFYVNLHTSASPVMEKQVDLLLKEVLQVTVAALNTNLLKIKQKPFKSNLIRVKGFCFFLPKKIINMKSLLHCLTILFFIITGISCSSDDDKILSSDTLVFSASLNGTNEVKTNISAAKGTSYLIYNKTTKIFTINIAYSGLTPTMAVIQKSVVNFPNQIIFTVGDFSNDNSFYNDKPDTLPNIHFTSPVLTTEQETDLLANRYYVNLYSSAYPEGEIRGQLINANPNDKNH